MSLSGVPKSMVSQKRPTNDCKGQPAGIQCSVSYCTVHTHNRPPDKSVYWKIIFFISHPKHMLWVLKRTVSMRNIFTQIRCPHLDLCTQRMKVHVYKQCDKGRLNSL